MSIGEKKLATIGVVADTHVPDRVKNLHPGVKQVLLEKKVDSILHAGDICAQQVLDELSEIAPVTAVHGNRDILLWRSYPVMRIVEISGYRLALMHGHGGWFSYLISKVHHICSGYHLEHYFPVLLNVPEDVVVVVFGHTHFPASTWVNGKLLFNPGSAGASMDWKLPPTVGVLHFYSDNQIFGEIIQLRGARVVGRRWQAI